MELAVAAGVDNRHAGRTIDALLLAGLVSETRAGGSRMIEMNREHLDFEPISALVGGRQRLVARAREELEPLSVIAGAWLFGSAARGDGDVGSDIDILLVGAIDLDTADWDEVVGQLRSRLRLWTGNDVQFVEHNRASLARMVSARNRLIAEIRRDGVALVERGASLLRGAA